MNRVVGYYSQDEATCKKYVDFACGPTSLANAFKIKRCGVNSPAPVAICEAILDPPLNEREGLCPQLLRDLASKFGRFFGLEAELVEPCTYGQLEAGDLLYINSVGLKNIQGGHEFEAAEFDSHIVVVERVTKNHLMVINPDCKQVGRDFTHYVWGRMKIRSSELESIWSTSRSDGVNTERAAVILRKRPRDPRLMRALRQARKRGRDQQVHESQAQCTTGKHIHRYTPSSQV